jgi:hypothetical protein
MNANGKLILAGDQLCPRSKEEASHKSVIIRCLVRKSSSISNLCTEQIMYEYTEKERKKQKVTNGFQKEKKITY